MNPRPALVIFDLDGTLTRPILDFDAIRAEIGIASGTILEALPGLPAIQLARALAIIERHERIAAADSELRDGAREVLNHLKQAGIRTAIATRNSRASLTTVLDKHDLAVDHSHTRDDGPVKPSPAPVRAVCHHLGVPVDQSWMVGDYLYDIQAGKQAGAGTVLLVDDDLLPDYAGQADRVVHCLEEVLLILENGSPS